MAQGDGGDVEGTPQFKSPNQPARTGVTGIDLDALRSALEAEAREKLEARALPEGAVNPPRDIEVRDVRSGGQVLAGAFTRWYPETGWISIWVDTGFQVTIRRVALEPIISELVQEEVKERLKGKEE